MHVCAHTYTHTHLYQQSVPPLSSAGDGAPGSHSTQIDVSMLTDATTHYSPHVLIVPLHAE